MATLRLYVEASPLATVAAIVFYASVLSILIFPDLKRWASTNLVMPAPANSQRYLAPLDAFRGFAALWVALNHTWQFPQHVFDATHKVMPVIALGNNAVPIFCMLSGFLIYRSVVRISTADELRKYSVRRVLRIFPCYVVTIMACIAIGQIPLNLPRIFNDVFMLRSIFGLSITNPPSWSLYVEVLFYGLMPCIVAVAGRRMMAFCICAVVVLMVSDTISTRELALWKYFFLGALVSMAVTSLRAKLEVSSPSMRQRLPMAIFGLGLLVAFFLLAAHHKDVVPLLGIGPEHSISYSIGLGLGTGLLMVGAVCSPSLVRVFGTGPLRYLGAISYGLYLWHPIFLWLNFPEMQFDQAGQVQAFAAHYPSMPFWYMPLVFIPGELLLATLSFVLVERPFLVMRPKSASPPVQGLQPEALSTIRPSG